MMTHGRKIMLTAEVVHCPPHRSDQEFVLRVDQDGEGRVKSTALSPSDFAGVVDLDDGVEWTTYYPRDHKVVKTPSPRIEEGNPIFQLALAAQNYTMTVAPAPAIADCQVVCVTATPKAKGLDTRLYYLDARTSYVLRLETLNPGGGKMLRFDTRSITFLRQPPDMSLGVDENHMHVDHRPPPRDVYPPSAAKPLVGFEPIVPDSLPLGFIVRQTQIVGGGDDQFIALRLTDGLVHATVYQWRADMQWRRDPPFTRKGEYRQIGTIRLSLFGFDMSPKAREVVLAGFTR
jgi:hypothetical protein